MWLRHRTSVPILLIAAVGALLPGVALAHHHPDHTCSGDAGVIGDGGTGDGECTSGGDGGAEPDGPAPPCDPDSTEVAYYDTPPDEHLEGYLRITLEDPPPEGMAWLAGYNCDDRYLGGPYLVPDPDPVDIPDLREQARARVVPPLPAPRVSPADAVVQFPTWLWVEGDWTSRSATEVDGFVSVRVGATPVSVTWNLVDGTKTCDGPGIPWSEEAETDYEAQSEGVRGRGNPACTFEFANASSTRPDGVYHADVTVTWEFSWWLNGAPQGSFGSVDRTTSFDLRVGEIQTLITR